ncbi:autophagy- protein 2, partial [Ascosphaera atra]
MQKGAASFAKTTTNELLKLGAKVAIGTQNVLQNAENLLHTPDKTPVLPRDHAPPDGRWEDVSIDEDEKTLISLYADQPVSVIQGLRGGYKGLTRDLVTARNAIVAVPGE